MVTNPKDHPVDVNPYAAPAVTDPLQRPGVGAWRDGPLLVMHKDAELPRVCIYTGERAAGAREWRVVWRSGNDVFTRGKYLYLPLRRDHLRDFGWQRLQSLIGMLLMAVMLIAMLSMPLLSALGDWIYLSVVPAILLLGVIGLVMWLAGYYSSRYPLTVVRSSGDYLWLEGAHGKFLDQLPAWPTNSSRR
jgi:hypothetical protein